MDLRYSFSRHSTDDLLEFLQLSNRQKGNPYNNLEEYNKLSTIFNQDEKFEDKLQNVDNTIVISDEEVEIEASQELITDELAEELIYSIKDNLEIDGSISSLIFNDLECRSEKELQNIFMQLADLDVGPVINLGHSFKNANTIVIQSFIKNVLIKKIQTCQSEGLQHLLNEYFVKYQSLILTELSGSLLKIEDNLTVFLLNLNKLHVDHKTILFKHIVSNVTSLNLDYLIAMDSLLTIKVDFDTLNKLIDIMFKSAQTFSKEKAYGKLLFNIINNLGKYVIKLEKPLNHIIGTHSSIWKVKLQKIFNTTMEDSQVLSQSVRL